MRVLILAASCLALSGCANLGGFLTTPNADGSTVGQGVLQHLEMCSREYQGALGAGVTGGFTIKCPAVLPAGSQLIPLSQLGQNTAVVAVPAPVPPETPE